MIRHLYNKNGKWFYQYEATKPPKIGAVIRPRGFPHEVIDAVVIDKEAHIKVVLKT